MFFSVVSLIVCSILTVRLMLYSDCFRKQSNFVYRFALLVFTVYVFWQIIEILYQPMNQVEPAKTTLHILLLWFSFWVKPSYLPGNYCSQ